MTCYEVTDVQGVSGRVKADVEGGFAGVDQFTDFFLIGNLRNQSAGLQFFVNLHVLCLLISVLLSYRKPSLPRKK